MFLADTIWGVLRAPQGYPRKAEVAAPRSQEGCWSWVGEVQPPQPSMEPSLSCGMVSDCKEGGNFYFPSKAPRQPRGEVLQPLHLEEGCRNSPACGHLGPLLPSKIFPCTTRHGADCATALGNACRECGPGAGFGQQLLLWRTNNFHQHMAGDAKFTCALPLDFLGSHTAAKPSDNEANSTCSSAFPHGTFIMRIKLNK